MSLSFFRVPSGAPPFYKRLLGPLLVCAAVLIGAPAQAENAYRIPWENGSQPCWEAAARYHGIDPWLLYAIGYTESRHNPNAVNGTNRNKTRDMGLMQINSSWLPTLRQYGISESNLFNACASTYIGAWIMAKNFKRYGYSWEAIAAYNVGSLNTPERRRIGQRYARKVYENHAMLTRQFGAQAVSARPATVAVR